MQPSTFQSKIKPDDLATLNGKVKERGHVDREHLMEFLTLIPTNDGDHIVKEVRSWLYDLHNDPTYSKVVFPQGDIEAVISDLDSYGHVSTETILKFKQENSKTVPVS